MVFGVKDDDEAPEESKYENDEDDNDEDEISLKDEELAEA